MSLTSLSRILVLVIFFLCSPAVFAQASLGLSSGTAVAGTTITLDLSLSSNGTQSSGLQWKFSYSPSDFTAITVVAGPSATSASKTLSCSGASGTYTCLLYGMNNNVVASGVVATATMTLSTGTSLSRAVQVTNAVSSTAVGDTVATSATGGIVTVPVSVPVGLSSLSCTPTSILGNGSATCTVRLNASAPAGGAVVALTDNSTFITIPASVTVPAGASTASFTASVSAVTSDSTAVLSASINSTTASASLGLVAPTILSTLSCSQTSVSSGTSTGCTITLSKAAPAGGISVQLSDNNANLTVPASVMVAAGMTTGTFSATTGTITSSQTAIVTATLNGTSKTVSLGLTPNVTLTSMACSPTSLSSGASASCTVSISAPAPASGVAVLLSSNNLLLTVPGSVTVAANSTTAVFSAKAGTLASTTAATVTASANGGTVSSTITLNGPQIVSALTCSPSSVVGPGQTTCTVSLNTAAPAGGVTVALTSNSTSLSVTTSVVVPAGAMNVNFAAAASARSTDLSVTVTATAGGVSKTSVVTVTAPAQISTLVCSPATLAPSGTSLCTINLTKAVPTSVSVTLSDNSANLTIPASVTMAAGATSTTFNAIAGAFTTSESVTVTAALNGSSNSTAISLSSAVTISSLACAPTSLTSGASTTCTVSVSGPAPSGGLTVAIFDNNTLLTTPTSVLVAKSAATATFNASAGTVTSNQTVVVTATLNGKSVTSSVDISTGTMSACPCSIWSSSTVPAVIDGGDTASVELGVKFRNKVAGYVLGVRYYKASKNTGTHTGKLWTKGGTLLASVTFKNETASGWQQANFSTPVAVAANTTYIVSYWSPASHYSINKGQFASFGVTSGPLYALKDGEDGGNGVYKYSSSAYPNSTWNSSNYSVDVVFNTVPSTTTTVVPTLLSQTTKAAFATADATTDGSDKVVSAAKSAAATKSLSCSPKSVSAGETFQCELRLGKDRSPEDGSILVEASSSDVRIPAFVNVHAGQRQITFYGFADPAAAQSSITVTAGEGDDQVQDEIAIAPASRPVLTVPASLLVKLGEPVSFTVSAKDASELPLQLSAPELPAGASFQQEEGRLTWTPDQSQIGNHEISFTAVNSAGVSATSLALISVDSGLPTLKEAAQAACSPGAIASLKGRWLSEDPGQSTDPTGASNELGGARVLINGEPAPILSASPTQVDFLCPNLAAGTSLEITLETPSGATKPVQTTMLLARPKLVRAQDLNVKQALVTVASTNRIATVRDYHAVGEPAQLDDVVTLRATGLGIADSYAGSISVKIGNVDAQVESVVPSLDTAGVFLIQVRVPAAASFGDEVPVRLELVTPDGERHSSNTVTMAIE